MNWLDYFIPQVVFQGNSDYSRDIKVIKVTGQYKLVVDGIVQSCSAFSAYAKGRVWGRMAQLIDRKSDISSLLLLGMGAGTLLTLLEQKGKAHLKTTGVELDPVIISLAKKYFGLDELQNHKIIQADAYDVAEDPQKYHLELSFDCVVVDTYQGSVFPEKLSSDQFYNNISKLLTPHGYLIINRIVCKDDHLTVRELSDQLGRYWNVIEVHKVPCPVKADNYLFVATGKIPSAV